MTPETSPTGDSSIPPRHRPSIDALAKETTERDLWAMDDDLGELPEVEEPEAPADADPDAPKPRPPGSIPAARPSGVSKANSAATEPSDGSVRVNVSRPQQKKRSGLPAPSAVSATPEQEFDDLDQWDEGEASAESPAPAAKPTVQVIPEEPAQPERTPVPTPEPPEPTPAPETPEDLDEFNPHAPANAAPISLQPHLSLSKFERVGLIALAVALAAVAGFAWWFSLKRIPDRPLTSTESDFPISGKLVTVRSAETYWRAPVTEGPAADTVRRGTILIPAIELRTAPVQASLRVVFKDETGSAVGDITTREISGGTVSIAATAGFDELGMHAAYRAGSTEPWTVEVLEGPRGALRSEEFTPLFEIEMSALRR